MSLAVQKSPQAFDDLSTIATLIAHNSPLAAERFIDAAEAVFRLLSGQPLAGSSYPHPSRSSLRSITIGKPYNRYVVFYEATETAVVVIRVLHGSREVRDLLAE